MFNRLLKPALLLSGVAASAVVLFKNIRRTLPIPRLYPLPNERMIENAMMLPTHSITDARLSFEGAKVQLHPDTPDSVIEHIFKVQYPDLSPFVLYRRYKGEKGLPTERMLVLEIDKHDKSFVLRDISLVGGMLGFEKYLHGDYCPRYFSSFLFDATIYPHITSVNPLGKTILESNRVVSDEAINQLQKNGMDVEVTQTSSYLTGRRPHYILRIDATNQFNEFVAKECDRSLNSSLFKKE